MLALAEAPATAHLSVTSIADGMAIPVRFLPRVMRDLLDAGLVTARIGRTGGYRLARPAAQITLLDVIDAVEGTDSETRCILRGSPCGVDGRCAVHEPFIQARSALRAELARADLASLRRPRTT